jgi:uncharacterized membrane protein (Fun14 family)
MTTEEELESTPPSTSLPWRRRLVLLLMILVSVSIVGRMALASRNEQTATADSGTTDPDSGLTTLMPQDPGDRREAEAAEQEPPGVVDKLLPFLTEGGIAMLIGIALGMATRAVAKLAAIVLAIVFIVIQFLAMKGVLTMDWGAFANWLHDFVLNFSSDEGVGSLVKHKLPAAGSLIIGYLLGLKRG